MVKLNPEITISITNDAELVDVLDTVNVSLQSIHNYLKNNPGKKAKIRFPRGYLGSIYSHSSKFSWLEDPVLSKNIAYQHVFVDTLRWMANHTDLFSTGRDMLLKNALVSYGSIFEALLYGAIKQLDFIEGKVPTRLNRLEKEGVINESLRKELDWLWNLRQSIHIKSVDVVERQKYSAAEVNRSFKALERFKSALSAYFAKVDFL
jgi:hypothetical protein